MEHFKKWYTIEKSTNKWVVWLNGESEHTYGSKGIFRDINKKECINFCEKNNIKLGKRKQKSFTKSR